MLVDIVLSKSLDMKIPWTYEHFEKAKQEVPLRCFGVFVTARRAIPLQKWPEDIHGCVGYWNPDFQEEPRDFLVEKASEVGYQAVWQDERRLSFQRNIFQEPDSLLELDFMIEPVIPVDPFTGRFQTNNKLYDNNTYGLIVEGVDGSRATYLPHVFPNTSWKNLKLSLLEKAGIIGGRFFAYRIRQVKTTLGSFCESSNVRICVTDNFKRLLFQHARTTYPFFPIHYQKDQFLYDPKEDVRNTGLLLDAVKALEAGVPFTKAQEKYLGEAVGAMARIPSSDQAKAFLLPCMSAMGYRTEYLCRDLVGKLRDMERQFQFGETLVGIANGGCKYMLVPYRRYLLESYPLTKADDIFQLNWDCQALVAIYKQTLPKQVLESLVTVLQKNKIGEDTFTNVLAVAWEAIQHVYPYCSLYYKKQLDKYRLFICWLLQQRTNHFYPSIYMMLQGDARLDITSHVLGGWNVKIEGV